MNPASAKTSVNQIPRLHKEYVKMWGSTDNIFDFGAGKAGKVDQFMAEHSTQYHPYDPFNRDANTNARSLSNVSNCFAVLCSNVINVLEDEALNVTIEQLVNLTEQVAANVCYITVYYRSNLPAGRIVGDHFQRNQPAKWYIPFLKGHFETVYLKNNIIRCFAF